MIKLLHHDVITGFMLLIFSFIFFSQTMELPAGAALFPRAILIVMVFFSLGIMINGFRKSRKEKKGEVVKYQEDEGKINFKLVKYPLIFSVLLSIYILIIGYLGFFTSTALIIGIILYILDARKILTYIFVIFGTNIFIYILFVSILNVNLPAGILM